MLDESTGMCHWRSRTRPDRTVPICFTRNFQENLLSGKRAMLALAAERTKWLFYLEMLKICMNTNEKNEREIHFSDKKLSMLGRFWLSSFGSSWYLFHFFFILQTFLVLSGKTLRHRELIVGFARNFFRHRVRFTDSQCLTAVNNAQMW